MHRIVLSAPGKNAMSTPLLRTLRGELRAAAGEAVLLTGEGDAFSAGLNLKEVASLDAAGMRAFLELLEEVVTALYLHPAPTVAAVNGHAIAGGCILALACDVRIATPNERVRIGLNEVAIGLRFPPRTFAMARARVPQTSQQAVFLEGGLFDPQRALALGLVDELAADPVAAAEARLATLEALPRVAYAGIKGDLRGRSAQDLCPDALAERFLSEALPAWTSDATRERVRAVLAKK
jgi:enoyl-CoA hydratase/carnithine racemase